MSFYDGYEDLLNIKGAESIANPRFAKSLLDVEAIIADSKIKVKSKGEYLAAQRNFAKAMEKLEIFGQLPPFMLKRLHAKFQEACERMLTSSTNNLLIICICVFISSDFFMMCFSELRFSGCPILLPSFSSFTFLYFLSSFFVLAYIMEIYATPEAKKLEADWRALIAELATAPRTNLTAPLCKFFGSRMERESKEPVLLPPVLVDQLNDEWFNAQSTRLDFYFNEIILIIDEILINIEENENMVKIMGILVDN